MAFDEEFHFGLIQIYAGYLTPFGIEHTNDMARYGAATADPSYLMHYILSFPYRLFETMSLPTDVSIVLLRLLNVGMFVAGLVVFRKGLHESGVSKIITNTTIALFALIPIAPVLAGQINYDNPLLLVVALTYLFAIRISNSIERTDTIPTGTFWSLFVVALIGLTVKFAYAAIIAAIALWLLYRLYRSKSGFDIRARVGFLAKSTQSFSSTRKIILIVGVLLAGFFSTHYIANVVQYGSFVPDCDEVFDETSCLEYGPYRRNAELKATLADSFQPLSFVGYLASFWVPDMIQRLTFAVAGQTNDYQTKPSLDLMYGLSVTLGIAASILLLASLWLLRSRSIVWITILVCLLYVAPLAVRLYGSYVTHGEPIAINGRYLLPVLPLVFAVALATLSLLTRKARVSFLLPSVTLGLLLLTVLAGGGVGTYIVLAEPHWLWPGFGQNSHALLQSLFSFFVIR